MYSYDTLKVGTQFSQFSIDIRVLVNIICILKIKQIMFFFYEINLYVNECMFLVIYFC